MKMSIGRIGGMLAVALLISAGPARATRSECGEAGARNNSSVQTARESAKIEALAEFLYSKGDKLKVCHGGEFKVESQYVYCNSSSQGALATPSELKNTPFTIFVMPDKEFGYLVYKPYVTDQIKTFKDLQETQGIFSSEAINTAHIKALNRLAIEKEEKAIEDLKKKVQTSGIPFDSK
jgi:hypothetical protein